MRNVVFLIMAGLPWALHAQDTFSIVAVDPDTRQVGSAGATCLDSVLEGTSAVIISYIKPGVGAIHTQSYWNPINQANASTRMDAGDSPEAIMDWLEATMPRAIRLSGSTGLRIWILPTTRGWLPLPARIALTTKATNWARIMPYKETYSPVRPSSTPCPFAFSLK